MRKEWALIGVHCAVTALFAGLWSASTLGWADDGVKFQFLSAYHRQDYGLLKSYAGKSDDPGVQAYVLARSIDIKKAAAQQPLPAEVSKLLQTYRGVPGIEKLRVALLKEWAKNKHWTEFREHIQYVPEWLAEDDTELACASLTFVTIIGRRPPRDVRRAVLTQAKVFPSVCADAYSDSVTAGALEPELALERMMYLLSFGRRADIAFLTGSIGRDLEDSTGDRGRISRIVDILISARDDYESGRRKLEQNGRYFDDRLFSLIAVHVGAIGAQKLERSAHALIKSVRGYGLKVAPEVAIWRNRASILAGAWADLIVSIDTLPTTVRSEPVWKYWLSLALDRTGRKQQANELLADLSGQPSFYGILAAQQLGATPTYRKAGVTADISAVARTFKSPAANRAMSLYKVGLWVEGAVELNVLMRGSASGGYYAAAQYARQRKILDRQVSFAERATEHIDVGLRYPLAYEKEVAFASQRNGIPPEVLWGIMRQESRFVPHAISSAGAVGLMQVLPDTAESTWQRGGVAGAFSPSRLIDPRTNAVVGASYLRFLLQKFGGKLPYAVAAYNAGPRRVTGWIGKLEGVSGLAFIEAIPFDETRDYTKNVLANYVMYAMLNGRAVPSLSKIADGRPLRLAAASGVSKSASVARRAPFVRSK